MRSLGAVFVFVTALGFAACGGESNTAGTSNDSTNTPSACERFQAAQTLKDACDALGGGCPRTLRGYLGAGHGAPQNYARVGCGLTEIRDLDSGVSQSTAYDFDASGALVGFDRAYQVDDAICGTGEYTFGATLGGCDSVRECHIPANAADTGDVRGCKCPDPPPNDGVFATTSDCVYPAQPIADCQPGLFGQLSDGVVLRYGCGFYLTGYPSVVTCSYDPTGTLVGATREDDASETCAGVTLLQTGDPYASCDEEKTCVWDVLGGADPAALGLEPCGDTLPDAGGNTACGAWRNETDLAASCALIAQAELGECPADEQSYLAGLSDPTTLKAVVGCGITWYQPTAATFGGLAFAFDSDGNLVGYDLWSDATFGPCPGMFDYERGDELETCDVVESCDLGDDRMPTCR